MAQVDFTDSTNMTYLEMDGNIIHGTGVDWGGLAGGNRIFQNDGSLQNPLPANFMAASWKNDQWGSSYSGFAGAAGTTADLTTFTGSKDINVIAGGGWKCTGENAPQDKTDVMHTYATLYVPPVGDLRAGHQILYMGLERHDNNGTATAGFWFLKDRNVSCTSTGSATNFVGEHMDGDLLVVSDFTNGGSVATVKVYRWNRSGNPVGVPGSLGASPIATGADCATVVPTDNVCGSGNGLNAIATPWPTKPKSGPNNNVLRNGFFEAVIDLTNLTQIGSDTCFSQVIASTRASGSTTADIKDYTGLQLNTCAPQTGRITIIKNMIGGTDTFNFTSAVTGMSGSIASNGGQLGPVEVEAGTYTVTESAKAGWDLTSITCDDQSTPSSGNTGTYTATFNVEAGENIICTFTNTKKPTLTVNKVLVPSSDNGLFNLQIDSVNKATNVGNGGTTGAVEVTIGTHIVGETAGTGTNLADYTTVISGDCVSNGSVTLAAGENKVCTITNTRKATLIVKKAMEGGTAEFTYNGTPTGVISINNGTIQEVVMPGTYTSTETAPSSWDLTGISCDDNNSTGDVGTRTATFIAEAGETIICTFTNTKRGKIIIDKVTNPSGDSQPFTFTPNWGSSFNLTDTATPHDSGWLVPGTYSITETVPDGWDLTAVICSDQSDPLSISLQTGEIVTCMFTNTKRGSITIIKNTVGGNATFGYAASGSGMSDFSLATVGGTAQTTFNNLLPGAKTVNETIIPSNWYFTSLNCSDPDGGTAVVGAQANIDLDPGENITCTYTNTKRGSISGIKFEDKNGNGIKDTGDNGLQNWEIKLSGVASATVNTDINGNYIFSSLVPGTYYVCEILLNGWQQTVPMSGYSCPGGVKGYEIILGAGQDIIDKNFGNFKLVTISAKKFNDVNGNSVNNSEPNLAGWTIRLDKQGDSNPPSCSGGTVSGEFCEKVTNSSGNVSFTGLGPGTYIVSEVLQSGWIQTRPNASFGGIGAQADGTYILTLTSGTNPSQREFGNFQLGKISGYKFEDVNGNGIWDNGEPSLNNWQINLSGPINISVNTNSSGYYEFTGLTVGAYTISETVKTGWIQTYPATLGTYSVPVQSGTNSPNNNFGNFKLATLIIEKQTIPDGDIADFTFAGNIAGAIFDGEQLTLNNAVPGTYTSVETIPQGWVLTDIACDNARGTGNKNSATATFVPYSGDAITCVFTNIKNPHISITPTATNEVDEQHTFIVTVGQQGSGGFVPAVGVPATVTITPLGFSLVSDTCVAGTDSNGQCTVAINSSSAGVFTAHAVASLTIGGQLFNIATDGTGGSSKDAVKTYVDASIALDPLQETNNVNDPHTITVTVMKDLGTGPVPAAGEHVDFILTDANGAVSVLNATASTCDDTGANTDVNGQCVIVFNSDSPGTITTHATVTLILDTVTLTRSTDGSHGSTQDASKVYVAGKIMIIKQTLPSGSLQSFDFNPNYKAGFSLADSNSDTSGWLAPGTAYSVSEIIPPGWDQTSATCDHGTISAIEVLAGETTTCTFVNTKRGHLIVQKTTNPAGDSTVFTINASGTGTITGGGAGSVTDASDYDYEVTPGTYSVAETVPTGWDKTGDTCQSVVVGPGETKYCEITNTKLGKITIVKDAQPNDCKDFSYSGTLGSFVLDDDGDANGCIVDSINQDQSKTFENLAVNASYSITEAVPPFWKLIRPIVCTGSSDYFQITNGVTINLKPGEEVACVFVNEKQSPTRTQGFWKNHTQFTTNILNNYLGGQMIIGDGFTHQDPINSAAKLFGAWYSNVNFKTTLVGKKQVKREAIDKARILLAHQLITAKLNCAAFGGCASSIISMITSADTAYAGTNISLMNTVMGALDAFNNSGDTIVISPPLPWPGKATPKTSESIADKLFWDNP